MGIIEGGQGEVAAKIKVLVPRESSDRWVATVGRGGLRASIGSAQERQVAESNFYELLYETEKTP